MIRLSLILLTILLAAGCTQKSRGVHAEYPYNNIPAEQQTPSSEIPVTVRAPSPDGSMPDYRAPPPQTPSADEPPAPPPLSGPSPASTSSPAVVALVRSADEQYANGQLDAAAASIERALRIESRNAVLWFKLAAVRLAQNDPQQAESLAQKSISLAQETDRQLLLADWRLIADARRQNGDSSGALAADRRAVTYDDGF